VREIYCEIEIYFRAIAFQGFKFKSTSRLFDNFIVEITFCYCSFIVATIVLYINAKRNQRYFFLLVLSVYSMFENIDEYAKIAGIFIL
jgi:ABC-type uncharacterized transport system permease subunit